MAEPKEFLPGEQQRASAFRAYLLLLAVLLVAVLLVGYSPTRRLAGEGGVVAMLAGCGASLLGSLFASSWLRARAASVSLANVVTLVLGALASRLAVTVVVGAGLLLSNMFAPWPLLLWLAASHAALLVADTRYALAVAGQLQNGDGKAASERAV